MPDRLPHAPLARPRLALVEGRGLLARLAEPVPQDWAEAIDALLGWLGLDRDSFTAGESEGQGAAVFAPWHAHAPTAWQQGGDASLPAASWAASYLFDHGPGVEATGGTVDVALLSPLPQGSGLPDPAVLAAMLAAARAEQRERIAIIVHAAQRGAIAQQVAALGGDAVGAPPAVLAIEEALPALINRTLVWDAIIAMPDLRGVVFTLLAEASGVRGAWPVVWRGAAPGHPVLVITSERPGEGVSQIPLDAPALIQAMVLALHHGGCGVAARRLADGWVRRRDSGVTTTSREMIGPYLNAYRDDEFIATLAKGQGVGQRAVPLWRAVNLAQNANRGSRSPVLRVMPPIAAVSAR